MDVGVRKLKVIRSLRAVVKRGSKAESGACLISSKRVDDYKRLIM